MLRIVLVSCVLFIELAYSCFAQPVIFIKKEKESINIIQQVAMMQDSSGTLSFKEVSTQPFADKFILNSEKISNLGSTLFPLWCRFKIKNYTDQKLALVIDNSQLEWLDLFIANNNNYAHKSISAYKPFNRREVLLNKCFFLLDIPKDSTEVYYLRLQTHTGMQFPLSLSTLASLVESEQPKSILYGIYIGIMIIMILYNLFIYIAIRDNSYLFYILYVSFMALTNVTDKGIGFEFLWPSHPLLNHYITIIGCLTGIFAILFAMSFLHISRYSKTLKYIFYGIIFSYFISMAVILAQERFIGLLVSELLTIIATLMLFSAGIIVYRKGYKPALFYLVAWTFLLICVIIFLLADLNILPYNSFTANGLTIGSAIETLLLSLALANRINVYKKEKQEAQSEVLLSMEDNRKLIMEQNVLLEKKVEDRTLELKQTNKELTVTLQNLKSTQTQLIQSEKMASLGELTAGIAHEIQNPLNFVNNFSEVSAELIDELEEEIDKGNNKEVKNIAADLKQNLEKIKHHGQRADAIVKGMLQHSHGSAGEKQPTNINTLADEYLRLSYHGLRSKINSFNVDLQTDFDMSIKKINIIPQNVGRVFLNLFTNAFYSITEKKKLQPESPAGKQASYEPMVSVTTKKLPGTIEIRVRDNGNGIPQKIMDKIFQPFFTTKPTGEGTGLGLSLSYDIITKEHGGTIKAETKEGEFTEFIIQLPG
ncbi:MAG: 7TM diverse intracellular signaling domain-containing protein [Ginsengibacter sp.]